MLNDGASVPWLGALHVLLGELIDGAARDAGWVLNPGDRGLLASLDTLSAEAASASPDGRASIAAHVDHLRYGLELLNRWTEGHDPFADGNGRSLNQTRLRRDTGCGHERARLHHYRCRP